MIRLAALLLAALLTVAGCGDRSPAPELVVGSWPDAQSKLLAALYVSALRSYGFPAHAEAAQDPLAKLDSGAVTVVPVFSGTALRTFRPDAAELGDKQVYRALLAALPEGIAAGDYSTAAEDKPALMVTRATAGSWGGSDLSELPGHCAGVVLGRLAGSATPAAVGSCRLPPAREFRDGPAMLAALRAGELTAAWGMSTDDPRADLVVLADSSKDALIQAENVVPLYRRNALSTRQLLAVNEVAGVLDTAALTELGRQVAGGADPQAVADGWLGEHPLGR